MKKILFIDRDGTLALEPSDYQLDALDKLIFYPEVFTYLGKIAKEMDYELVMVTNQDGLGTDSFPEDSFWPTHNFLLKSFENEGVVFDAIHIDRSFPAEHSPNRKPRTGLLEKYQNASIYDLANSFVIGDRITDMELAKNLGCKGLFIATDEALGAEEAGEGIEASIALKTTAWEEIYRFLKLEQRIVKQQRTTHETDIHFGIEFGRNRKECYFNGDCLFRSYVGPIGTPRGYGH